MVGLCRIKAQLSVVQCCCLMGKVYRCLSYIRFHTDEWMTSLVAYKGHARPKKYCPLPDEHSLMSELSPHIFLCFPFQGLLECSANVFHEQGIDFP